MTARQKQAAAGAGALTAGIAGVVAAVALTGSNPSESTATQAFTFTNTGTATYTIPTVTETVTVSQPPPPPAPPPPPPPLPPPPPPPPVGPPPPPPPPSTYWVDPTGNDSNPGTSSAPWRTIQHAADTATAGQTVTVRDGLYLENGNPGQCAPTVICFWRSGTSAAPIVFKSEHHWGAIVSGNHVLPNAFTWAQSAASYVNVNGFDVRALRTTGGSVSGFELYNSGTGSKILNNNIHDIGRSATSTSNGQVGVFIYVNGVNVEGNYIHDIGRTSTGNQQDHGIYVNNGNNTIIRNNYFGDIAQGWGVQFYPVAVTGAVLEDNTFVGGFGVKNYSHLILGSNITGGQFNRNTFWASQLSWTIENYRGTFSVGFNGNKTTGTRWCDTATCTTTGGLPPGFTGTGNTLNAAIPMPPPPLQ